MTAIADPTTEMPTRASVSSRASAWLAIGAAVLAVVLAPPSTGDLLPPGVLGTIVDGQLEQFTGGVWRTASVGDLVAEGVRVRTPGSSVSIRTGSGTLELSQASEARLDVAEIELDTGTVVVDDAGPVDVIAPSAEARGRGTWRLDLGGSPRLGVYEGGATVRDASGTSQPVGALEQAALLEDGLGQGAVAYRYLRTDPWDARWLSGAIAVDQQITRLERTLTARYGTALQRGEFYRDFVAVDSTLAAALPGLARFEEDGRYGPPAGTLVAVVVTSLLTDRAALPASEAVEEIRTLRRSGATWGLILAHHDLGPNSFREAADLALRRRQQELVAGTAAPVITEVAESPSPTAPPEEDDEPLPPTEPPPPEEDPDPSEPPPPDGDGPTDQILDTTEDATDDVAELLEPVPGASEAVDDLSDVLEDPPIP